MVSNALKIVPRSIVFGLVSLFFKQPPARRKKCGSRLRRLRGKVVVEGIGCFFVTVGNQEDPRMNILVGFSCTGSQALNGTSRSPPRESIVDTAGCCLLERMDAPKN
jgi:hypothetical protein